MGLLLNVSCFLFGAFLFLTVEARNGKRHHCNDIPAETLRKILYDDSELHPSFYGFDPVVTAMNNTLDKFKEMNSDMVKIKYGIISNRRFDCSTESANPCPVRWDINYDENRFPSTLLEAKCLCDRRCLGVAGTVCMPVHHYFPVLRRIECRKDTETFIYQKVLEPISLSCACMKIGILSSRPHSK